MQEVAKDGEGLRVAGGSLADAGQQGLLQGALAGCECTTPCADFSGSRSGMGTLVRELVALLSLLCLLGYQLVGSIAPINHDATY